MLCKGILGKAISIHALREEGDNSPCVAWEQGRSISIHALREEGDMWSRAVAQPRTEFLSTPSARRATEREVKPYERQYISIHALREEGDLGPPSLLTRNRGFLSTPSARRATKSLAWLLVLVAYFYPRPPRGGRLTLDVSELTFDGISIHALREEGDRSLTRSFPLSGYFYPRPPRGGRRVIQCNTHIPVLFLSTPSARRATSD